MPLPSTTPVPKANNEHPSATVPALPIFKGSILYSVDEFLGTFNTVAAQAELTEQEKLLKVFSYIDKALEPVLSILRTCSYNDWATFERLLRTAYAVDTHGLEYVNHIINTFKANTPGFGVLVFLECYFAYTGVLCGSGELAYAQRFQLLESTLPKGFIGYLKRYLPDAERWLSDGETPTDMESWDRLIGLTRQYAASLRDENFNEHGYLSEGESPGLICSTCGSALSAHTPALHKSTPVSANLPAAKVAAREAAVQKGETVTAGSCTEAELDSKRSSSIMATPPEYLINPLMIDHKKHSHFNNINNPKPSPTSFVASPNATVPLFSLNRTPALPPSPSPPPLPSTPFSHRRSTSTVSNRSTQTTNTSKGSSPAPDTSACECSPIAHSAAKPAKRPRPPAASNSPATTVMGTATTTSAVVTAASTSATAPRATKRSPYQLHDKERRVWELFLEANRRVRRYLIAMTILESESDENENYSVDDILKNTEGSVFESDDDENDDAGLSKSRRGPAQNKRSKNTNDTNNNTRDYTGDDEGSSSDWSDPDISVAEIMSEFSRPGLTPQKEAVLVERYAEPLTGHKMSEFVNYSEELLAHVFEVVLTYTYTNLAASKI